MILLSLDNDVLETSKRRAMFYNILSQIFIVKCFTKSLIIRINMFFKKKTEINFGADSISCERFPSQQRTPFFIISKSLSIQANSKCTCTVK